MHIEKYNLNMLCTFLISSLILICKTPVTLILGDQGSGKTILLRLSYQALTWFSARFRDLRTAGLSMLDQDILQNRLQSKIDIQVRFPDDLGLLPESAQERQPLPNPVPGSYIKP